MQTIPRETLWLAVTPQMFRALPCSKHCNAPQTYTDEASAIEFLWRQSHLIEGEARNRKPTRPEDLEYLRSAGTRTRDSHQDSNRLNLIVKNLLKNKRKYDELKKTSNCRRFESARAMIVTSGRRPQTHLRGVEIPHKTGLLGPLGF